MSQPTKIKMVVVGLHFGQYIAEEHILTGSASSMIELSGVCDLNPTLSAALAAKHRIKQYQDFDEILQDPRVEAIGLFTGPNGRADLIRKIIRSGKHVMTTKPFERDADKALAVLQEARSLNRVVHLNSPGPLPAVETQQMLNWMDEIDLGQPVSLHWETYASYHNDADGSWYDDPLRCPVAPIFRLGIYGLNQIIKLCGPVHSVGVVSSRIRTGRPTPDNAGLSLLFENGVVGSVHASFCVENGHHYPNALTLHFERGTIRTSGWVTPDDKFPESKKLSLQQRDDNGRMTTKEVLFRGDAVEGDYQWSAFFKAVRSGEPLKCETTPEQVANTVRVINAMAEAEQSGRQVLVQG
jgi:predicted dehydrogenase